MDAIRSSGIRMGVDPLGGAGVHYWGPIAERYALNLTVVNEAVDPTFQFIKVDWDGQIRMAPFSPYAMQRLIDIKDRFDIAVACDTDHDRHGIVTKGSRRNNFGFWGVEAPVWQGARRANSELFNRRATQAGGMDRRSKIGSYSFASPKYGKAE
jgi:hypothetical protein